MDDRPESPDTDLLTELDLAPAPRILGALKREFHIEFARELSSADLAALTAPRGSRPKSLVRIHSSHHSLARCLATGMKPAQAALVTGYNPARISVLCTDEAFAALVADYRAEAKAIFADLAERMNDMSLDAIELLHERLQAKPEEFSVPMLLDVVKAFADRTGHGPNQDVNLNVKLSRDMIDRPPRETFEDWQQRRQVELQLPADAKKLN